MKILWQLRKTDKCKIKWGTDQGLSAGSAETDEYGDDHQHTYTITGLNPGTNYHYQVEINGNTYIGSFNTAPAVDAKKLKFIAYGDLRSHPDKHNLVVTSMLSTIKTDPEFKTIAVVTGDLVKFGAVESQWDDQLFNRKYKEVQEFLATFPLLSCVGNHEIYEKDYKGYNFDLPLFRKYFPYPEVKEQYWSFDYGPAHFVMVNQYVEDITEEQLPWIENDLKSSKKPWKFVVYHEPGWLAGEDEHHVNNEDVRDYIQPLLEKYNVAAVFAGHHHYYGRAVVNGVHHIITGGGGASLVEPPDPKAENIVTAKKAYHYCKIEINGGNLKFEAVEPDGTIIDSFEIKK